MSFESSNLAKELREIQSQMFDKNSAYTKIILGLGYGGFFAAWSGGKGNLRPIELMSSAFLMLVSLLLFITFEIYETYFLSRRTIDFATALSAPEPTVQAAIAKFRSDETKALRTYVRVWRIIFPTSTATGILGASILIEAFARSVWRLKG